MLQVIQHNGANVVRTNKVPKPWINIVQDGIKVNAKLSEIGIEWKFIVATFSHFG